LAELLAGESLFLMGQQVLAGDVGAEECGVVGVEGDEQAGIEVLAEGVLGEGGADAGADVRGGVEFEGDGARLEFRDKRGILNGGKGVADSLGADAEGFPNGFGAGGFAGARPLRR